jgi:protein-disulfide isomerase
VAKSQRPSNERTSKSLAARSPLTPFYVILGLIAVAGIGVLLYQVFRPGQPALSPVPVAIDPAELARAPGIAMGPEDAPVVVYEFADYQCFGCAQFATFVAPVIKERFVDRGTVRYVYYDFPLTQIHAHAFLASRAARCAGDQDQYWPYHDMLYGRQPRWASQASPTSAFVNYAGELGLDRSAFESCLRSDRHALEVTQNLRLGESLGVQGTPTLFINGKRLPSIPSVSEFTALVQEEMRTSPAAGASPGAEPDQTGRETPGVP